jgi:hypothetical protein
MEKNTILAIVLSSLVLIGFMFLQTYLNPPVDYPVEEVVRDLENTPFIANEENAQNNLEKMVNLENFDEEVYI